MAKLTISLPDDLDAAVRSAVADGRGASVSAVIAEALAERFRNAEIRAALAALDDEHGLPGAADLLWAEQAWRAGGAT